MTLIDRDARSVGGLLTAAGGFARGVRTIADIAWTLAAADALTVVTSWTATHAMTLPALSTVPAGQEWWVVDAAEAWSVANPLTAIPNGTDKINGSNTTQTIASVAGAQLRIVATSAGWKVTFALPGSGALILHTVTDVTYTITGGVNLVVYTSLTANRSIVLPAASSQLTPIIAVDASGNASPTKIIGFSRTGADTLNGFAGAVNAINNPRGIATAISDQVSNYAIQFPNVDTLNAQTIVGIKTFLNPIVAQGGLAGLPVAGSIPLWLGPFDDPDPPWISYPDPNQLPQPKTLLTDGATITWATGGAMNNIASVSIVGNRTLSLTGMAVGATGLLAVTQGAGAPWTLAVTGKVAGGGAGVVGLSTAAAAIDLLAWYYDGTTVFWTVTKNFT